METKILKKIGEDIIILQPPPVRIFRWRRSGNIILVKGSEGVSLFDSGGTSSKQHLVSLLESEIKTQTTSIHCLHTHGHIDHIGGDELLIRNYDAKIWASKQALPFVKQQVPISLELERPHLLTNFNELFSAPEWFVRGVMRLTMGRNKQIEKVKELEPKSDPSGTNFFPINTPGHHAGHLGFFNSESGVFISGDILDPRYDMKPLLTSPSSNYTELQNSIRMMIDLSIKTLIPGHGSLVIGYEAVEQSLYSSLEIMERSIDSVMSLLSENPHTLQDLSLELRGYGLGPGDVFRRMFIHSILKELYEENKISKRVDEKNRTWFIVNS